MYHTIYDALSSGPDFSFAEFGLIFVAIGVGLVVARKWLAGFWGWPFSRLSDEQRALLMTVFACIYLGFALFWTLSAATSTLHNYHKVKAALANGQASVVTGPVQHFHAWIPHQSPASFIVASQQFEYWGMGPGEGFQSSRPLPIRDGDCVRITSVGDIIVRVERSQPAHPSAGLGERSSQSGC